MDADDPVIIALILPGGLHHDLDHLAGRQGISVPDLVVNLVLGWNVLRRALDNNDDQNEIL